MVIGSEYDQVNQAAFQAAVLDQVKDAILVTDLDLHITYLNHNAVALFGYSLEEAAGQVAGNMLHTGAPADEREKARRTALEQGVYRAEFPLKDRSGCMIWVDSSTVPFKNQQGQPVGLIHVLRDVTARKKAEQALRDSEARERAKAVELETLMDTVPAMIWIARDRECRVMQGNRYGYKFLRMAEADNISKTAPPEALQVQPYRNFKNGREIPPSELPMQVAAATGQGTENYEFDLVFEDGTTCSVIGSVAPILNPSGSPAGAVGAFIDITERKRFEHQLRESEARFKMALSNAPIIVFNMDRELRYTWIHNSHAHFDETNRVLGHTDAELLGPEESRELVRLKRQVIETGRGLRQEVSYTIAGRPVTYDCTFEPVFDEMGRVNGLTAAVIDLTDVRSLENERLSNLSRIEVQRRLIEQREQERLQIARDLHDGPLQELIGLTYACNDIAFEAAGTPAEKIAQEMKVILQAQIAELRSYAANLRPPTLASFGLQRAIKAHLDEFRDKHPEIEIHFDADQQGDLLPDTIRVALFRIYQELINNIIKHAQASKIWVFFYKDKHQALLEVKDNGIGFDVPKDWLSLARQKHLGLVGIQERAEAVDGVVEIKSGPGKGTSVRVTIPLQE